MPSINAERAHNYNGAYFVKKEGFIPRITLKGVANGAVLNESANSDGYGPPSHEQDMTVFKPSNRARYDSMSSQDSGVSHGDLQSFAGLFAADDAQRPISHGKMLDPPMGTHHERASNVLKPLMDDITTRLKHSELQRLEASSVKITDIYRGDEITFAQDVRRISTIEQCNILGKTADEVQKILGQQNSIGGQKLIDACLALSLADRHNKALPQTDSGRNVVDLDPLRKALSAYISAAKGDYQGIRGEFNSRGCTELKAMEKEFTKLTNAMGRPALEHQLLVALAPEMLAQAERKGWNTASGWRSDALSPQPFAGLANMVEKGSITELLRSMPHVTSLQVPCGDEGADSSPEPSVSEPRGSGPAVPVNSPPLASPHVGTHPMPTIINNNAAGNVVNFKPEIVIHVDVPDSRSRNDEEKGRAAGRHDDDVVRNSSSLFSRAASPTESAVIDTNENDEELIVYPAMARTAESGRTRTTLDDGPVDDAPASEAEGRTVIETVPVAQDTTRKRPQENRPLQQSARSPETTAVPRPENAGEAADTRNKKAGWLPSLLGLDNPGLARAIPMGGGSRYVMNLEEYRHNRHAHEGQLIAGKAVIDANEKSSEKRPANRVKMAKVETQVPVRNGHRGRGDKASWSNLSNRSNEVQGNGGNR